MAFTALILTEVTVTQDNFVDISYHECHPNLMKNVENMAKISLMPSIKICLSLHWISQNPQQLVMKLITVQWPYMEISYTKFHPNWPRNTESTVKGLFLPFSKVWLSPSRFSQNSCLLENLLQRTATPNFMKIWNCLFADIRLQTDRLMLSPHKLFFLLLHKECLNCRQFLGYKFQHSLYHSLLNILCPILEAPVVFLPCCMLLLHSQ